MKNGKREGRPSPMTMCAEILHKKFKPLSPHYLRESHFLKYSCMEIFVIRNVGKVDGSESPAKKFPKVIESEKYGNFGHKK